MRSLLVVCLVGSIAQADPALPIDILAAGKTWDWAAYDTERLDGDKLVKERSIVVAGPGDTEDARRVFWFRGQPDKEVKSRPSENLRSADTRVFGFVNAKNLAATNATCKLDASFPCSKVTFTAELPELKGTALDITATMAARVQGVGLVELEARQGAKTIWKLKVIGYGGNKTSTWGVPPSKAKLQVAMAYEYGKLGVDENVIGPGTIGGGAPRRDPMPPIATLGAIEATGGDLDKAIIRRYLRRYLNRLAYCYEKEQLAKPKLKGKLAITFAIDAEGKVSSSSAKGVDPEIERCAGEVLEAIQFPKPKNGKQVEVKSSVVYAPRGG